MCVCTFQGWQSSNFSLFSCSVSHPGSYWYMKNLQALCSSCSPYPVTPKIAQVHSSLQPCLGQWHILLTCHPEQQLAKYIQDGIQHGFQIGFIWGTLSAQLAGLSHQHMITQRYFSHRSLTCARPPHHSLWWPSTSSWTPSWTLQGYCRLGIAPSTRRMYESAVRWFSSFCLKCYIVNPFPVDESILFYFCCLPSKR